MVPKVEANGFTGFAVGNDNGLTPIRRPLVAVDMEKEIQMIGKGFARRIPREIAADMLPLCETWHPDVIVCEEMDFGAMIVAERSAIPYASVLVIASGALIRREIVVDSLDEVRAEHGLPPDPELTMLSRHLVLSPFPPSFRDPAFPLPTTAHTIRPLVPEAPPDAEVPVWLANLPDAPTVYFTLGTVFNVESGDLFQRVLQGLRDLSINLIMTVGRDIDPLELGAQPDNVHVERFISQALLLPHCDLVVSHGGSGSVMGALTFGLPMVLIPMGADQPLNGDRCVALGVAKVLDPITVTPEEVRDTVATVLAELSYRQAAQRVKAEIDSPPDAAHALKLIEQLAHN
jgi:UDP:flavonoid glycosyltransferase YjiC (YdhE family)